MLRLFKQFNFDRHNSVGLMFQTYYGKSIVFEVLGISLVDYLDKTSFALMLLSDIRAVIQQV